MDGAENYIFGMRTYFLMIGAARRHQMEYVPLGLSLAKTLHHHLPLDQVTGWPLNHLEWKSSTNPNPYLFTAHRKTKGFDII